MNLFKNILILIIVTTLTKVASTQQIEVTNYPFMNLNADTLILYGQSKAQFQSFVDKFVSMVKFGKQQINILHIGDENIQSDNFSSKIRHNFQSFHHGLEGSLGMLPSIINNSSNFYTMKFSSDWKTLDGISSSNYANNSLWTTTIYTNSTFSTIDININSKNNAAYNFNKIRIYHSPLLKGNELLLSDINIAYQKIYYEDKGYTEFILADDISTFKIILSNPISQVFYLYGFYFNNDNAGITYNISGINNAKISSFLYAGKFLQHLKTIDVDLVIISLGMNDMMENGNEELFENNLLQLVNNIKIATKDIPIILTTPPEYYISKKEANSQIQKTINIINNVAQKTSCIYLNIYDVIGGKGSNDKLLSNNLIQNDRIHFTIKGYQLQADILFNAIWNEIEKIF